MMSWRMMLGEVVCQIVTSRRPTNVGLALLGAVLHPIEVQVHGARALLLDCAIEDAVGCGIIDLQIWSGWLRVSHFGECSAHNHSFFSIKKCSANLSFCGQGDNMFKYFSNGKDSFVDWLVAGRSFVT
jgi:hypothetical protein